MDKNGGKIAGKTDEGKDVGNGTSAADLFNVPSMHILTVLLGMQLDGRHTRV